MGKSHEGLKSFEQLNIATEADKPERERLIQEAKSVLRNADHQYGVYLGIDWKMRTDVRDFGEPQESTIERYNVAKQACLGAQQAEAIFKQEHPWEAKIADIDNRKDHAVSKIVKGDVYNGGGQSLAGYLTEGGSLKPEDEYLIALVEDHFGKGSVRVVKSESGEYTYHEIRFADLKSVQDEVKRLRKEKE